MSRAVSRDSIDASELPSTIDLSETNRFSLAYTKRARLESWSVSTRFSKPTVSEIARCETRRVLEIRYGRT